MMVYKINLPLLSGFEKNTQNWEEGGDLFVRMHPVKYSYRNVVRDLAVLMLP